VKLKQTETPLLAVACLIAMAYALARGELWSAGLCAFFGIYLLTFYRREKRSLDRQP
jgi:hypothetical protein